jgi:2-succinyl-5-enolpyruvyl-6-hydroxy-3-cyclohexene-1-carboxylate synthase
LSTSALQGDWARLLFDSLARSGVQHVVLSPGSRSTPFAWAALERDDLDVEVAIDERSAAFAALGAAKVTGKPSLLVCTSGSAATNYFPAIVEADHSATPLLVLTSDRPLELQSTFSPQVIDQVKLYGDAVREYFDLGAPDAAPSALAGLQRMAAHAVCVAQYPVAGPVQLNARARKPLAPRSNTANDVNASAESYTTTLSQLLEAGPPRVSLPGFPRPGAGALKQLAQDFDRAQKPLLSIGFVPIWRADEARALLAACSELGISVAAELPSQLRAALAQPGTATPIVDGLELLLGAGQLDSELKPDLIVQLGPPLVSSRWARYLGGHSRYIVVHDRAWPDASQHAAEIVMADPLEFVRELCEELRRNPHAQEARQRRERYRTQLLSVSARGRATLVARMPEFGELHAVHTALGSVPAGSLLCLGNSLPVREADLALGTTAPDVLVWTQRGTNGIDGLIAGAYGAARAARRPALLLLGDVSFAHDVGSLSLLRGAEHPFVVVVIDNDGGRIFETLPRGALVEERERFRKAWLTPPELDIVRVAAAFGVEAAELDGTHGLREAVERAFAAPRASILRVRVDPGSAARLEASLDELTQASIGRGSA